MDNTVYFGELGRKNGTGWCVYCFNDEAMPELISAFSKVGVEVKRDPAERLARKTKLGYWKAKGLSNDKVK